MRKLQTTLMRVNFYWCVCVMRSDYDIEDDRMHDFRFRWDPVDQMITVFWDGAIVYEGTRDLLNDIFEGEKNVIWGFTASTGRAHNLQYFCLRRLVLNESTACETKG